MTIYSVSVLVALISYFIFLFLLFSSFFSIYVLFSFFFFFFSSRRRHTRCSRDWSSDVCSSDLVRQSEQSVYTNCSDCRTSNRELIPCSSKVFVKPSESWREPNVRLEISNSRSNCRS